MFRINCTGTNHCERDRWETTFPLVSSNSKTLISYDENDFEVVKEAAHLFVEDIRSVTGKKLTLSGKQKTSAYMVIIGTVGQNRTIDRFVSEGKLDISPIHNGWEQYIIQTLDNPDKNIRKALVIAGLTDAEQPMVYLPYLKSWALIHFTGGQMFL